jgi:hypothetical protein
MVDENANVRMKVLVKLVPIWDKQRVGDGMKASANSRFKSERPKRKMTAPALLRQSVAASTAQSA